MDLSRRDLLKLGGTAAAALGASQCKVLNTYAMEPTTGVDVYAFRCGILKTQTQYILKDTRVGVPFDIPVPFYVIRHGSSWVAYDSGNNAAVAVDPIKYWGEAVCNAYMPVMQPYEEFQIQLKKLGLKPQNLSAVIMSHGHLDHCGALEDLAGSDIPIYFQKAELDHIKEQVASGKRTAYIPADFDKMGQCNIRTLDGMLDVFGDQSVIVLPTPGHTPGHQSVLVRTSGGQNLILAQDACYTLEKHVRRHTPGIGV